MAQDIRELWKRFEVVPPTQQYTFPLYQVPPGEGLAGAIRSGVQGFADAQTQRQTLIDNYRQAAMGVAKAEMEQAQKEALERGKQQQETDRAMLEAEARRKMELELEKAKIKAGAYSGGGRGDFKIPAWVASQAAQSELQDRVAAGFKAENMAAFPAGGEITRQAVAAIQAGQPAENVIAGAKMAALLQYQASLYRSIPKPPRVDPKTKKPLDAAAIGRYYEGMTPLIKERAKKAGDIIEREIKQAISGQAVARAWIQSRGSSIGLPDVEAQPEQGAGQPSGGGLTITAAEYNEAVQSLGKAEADRRLAAGGYTIAP